MAAAFPGAPRRNIAALFMLRHMLVQLAVLQLVLGADPPPAAQALALQAGDAPTAGFSSTLELAQAHTAAAVPAGCFLDPGVIDNATGPVAYPAAADVFPKHATAGTQLVDSAAGCCTLCQSFANCSFWTFGYSGTAAQPTCRGRPGKCCYLKTADAWGQGVRVGPGNVSGSTAPLPPLIPPGQYPYPGPAFTHPRIHQSPECVHQGGWHDMAGALTFKGVHHAFQGCPSSGGWSHSTSTDLVHWKDLGVDMRAQHETYEGMDSNSVPCAGFITVDDDGIPCAGFRQCSSDRGTTGLNPQAKSWDVPMEL